MEPGDSTKQARAAAQLRKGVLEYCVLALMRDRPRYGVELLQALEESGALATSQGTVYPLLSRLRRDDLVTTTWQESASGPPRRYYALTDSGRAALDEFTLCLARASAMPSTPSWPPRTLPPGDLRMKTSQDPVRDYLSAVERAGLRPSRRPPPRTLSPTSPSTSRWRAPSVPTP
ncbi:hypothetical protein SMICM304S_09125 [Streptomyces microflavus]